MRQAGVISDDRLAALFAAYLTAQGVENRIDRSAGGEREIWVRNDDQVELAKTELAAFLANPQDGKYQGAPQAAKRIERERKRRWKAARKNFIDMSRHWDKPTAAACPVTFALIAVSVTAFAATFFPDYRDRTFNLLGIVPWYDGGEFFPPPYDLSFVKRGEIWRIVTPVFLHMNLIHIFCNMSWLLSLGVQIETRRGSWRYAALVLFIAGVSNWLQFEAEGPFFGGMSGVVFGLFGYVWMKSRYDPGAGLHVDRVTAQVMLIWLAICMTGCVGSIANTAHLSGLAIGAAIGFFPPKIAKLLKRPSKIK